MSSEAIKVAYLGPEGTYTHQVSLWRGFFPQDVNFKILTVVRLLYNNLEKMLH